MDLMELPIWILGIIVLLIAAALVGLYKSRRDKQQPFLKRLADFAMVITLAVILAYTYYTYMLVKDTYSPIVTFSLQQLKREDPYEIAVVVQNMSKIPVRCWSDFHATIFGNPVFMDGFYGGNSPWDIQPYTPVRGYFNIKEILEKAGRDLNQIQGQAASLPPKQQLYFRIEFSYIGLDKRAEKGTIPGQHYYFDFKRNAISMDF